VALKITPFDEAKYLKTEEERLAYLLVCLEDAPDDAEFIAHAVGVVARSRNMSQLARDTGLTREGLYKALSESGNPSFSTIWKVLNALGYRLTIEPISATKARPRSTERIAAKRAPRAATKSATIKIARKKTKR